MANPYSAGGGGTHLEARVVASCLAAVLSEAPFRGLPGEFTTELRTQRADFGDPLDDIVLYGVRDDGKPTQLHLQIKNKLTFTDNDDEWSDVLRRAWQTASKSDFDVAVNRVGVGIGTYSARAEQHYQSVLNWAVHSTDSAHFFERIAKGDYSHKDKQSFVETTRKLLTGHASRNVTDDELWKFLKGFVIVHFDFQSEERSRDAANAIDRLAGVLTPTERAQAPKIWDHLIAKAGELVPAGGGATRQTLVDTLNPEGFHIATAPSFWHDIQALRRESERGLSDIKSTIHGLQLHRAEAYEAVRSALADSRFIQISGEPGSGKSALLKQVAEESSRNGPLLVLKDTRIHPKGWSAHAHILGVSDDIAALLREFACAGEPILFIDGIDKIVDPAVQLTVNDLLRAIANNENLSSWRILATVREQNLTHLETWLDPDALKKLPLRTVELKSLTDDELVIVAAKFSRLRALFNQTGGADVVLRRPFFLDAILNLAGRNQSAQLPATEVELLRLWWGLGASDRPDFSSAQHRRNVLLELADRLSHTPKLPISIRDIAPETLEELKSSGVIRDKELGHSTVFSHDIYEEWALCQLLISKQSVLTAFLKEVAEPDLLIRPTQLLGSYALETDPPADSWKSLYQETADPSLRPVWQRTILTSCLQSTRTTQLLSNITGYLLESDGERLKKLLLAITTVEVFPNPLFLDEKLVPNLSPEERAKFAHHTALPKPLTWVRFLDWLMPLIATLPAALIPDILPVFSTWQSTYSGSKIRHCREIGTLSYTWLKEFEASRYPRKFEDRRRPFGGVVRDEEAEKTVRSLFLASTGDVPKLVSEYLRAKRQGEMVHVYRDQILKNCAPIIRHLPTDLVDFILDAFFQHPKDKKNPLGYYSEHDADSLGLIGHFEFYPASPIQLPFLQLLRLHETEGLRLIRSMCNFSIAVWRWARENRRSSEAVKPLPLRLEFPWGKQTFWGDGQVYLWFRGTWGNHACRSGLMAIEQWALEKLEAGTDFNDIFKKVIEGNETVAALGIGVSLCLAKPNISFDSALPLVTCPQLWQWDIRRYVQDIGSHANEIGDWFRHRTEMTAVRELNQKPHRKETIRSIIPVILIRGDEALVKAYTKGIRSFPRRLPFSYEHEKKIPEYVAELKEQMKLYVEQGDPKYWRTRQSQDGKYIEFFNDPPSLTSPKYIAQQQQHSEFNEASGVALWAQKSLEGDMLEGRLAVVDGVVKARQWDNSLLFEIRDSKDFEHRQRASAVSGAAFVAARHASREEWTDSLSAWCMDVLERAATCPEGHSEFSMRMSSLVMHPAVFAAHGYSALLARDFEPDRCKQGLLNLAVDALMEVQSSVFSSAKYYAGDQPDFLWALLMLGMRQCVVKEGDIPDVHTVTWEPREAERLVALISEAEESLASSKPLKLPTIPLPWIKSNNVIIQGKTDTNGYGRNDWTFLYHLADKLLFKFPYQTLLANPVRRRAFLELVGQILDFTIQEMRPPFAKGRHDHEGNTPFEWVFDFSGWCGRVCTYLTEAEVKELAFARIFSGEIDTALMILQSFIRGFMIEAFLRSEVIKDSNIELWKQMAEWLFECSIWKRNRDGDHLDREFTIAAFCVLFCVAPDFSPIQCGVGPGWSHLPKFEKTLERAVKEFGRNRTLYIAVMAFFKNVGADLLPKPGLSWLQEIVEAKKQDQKFWKANGEDTVELLKSMISAKHEKLTADHRKAIIGIADILVDNGVRGAGFLQQELLRADQ